MFKFFILTLEKTLFDGSVHSVLVPSADGYFEVFNNHAPLIALVRPGRLEIHKQAGEKEVYAVSGGFFEVANNKATLIADEIEKASEIDLARAELALKKALERLASEDESVDIERARQARDRAENRVKTRLIFQSMLK